MKKIFLIAAILTMFACETGLELNLDVILKHTAEHVVLETTLDTVEMSITNLSWTWGIYGRPNANGVIIERDIGSGFDSIGYVEPIETLMTFFDTTDALEPGRTVTYNLLLKSGTAIDSMYTTDFEIPEAQQFIEPDTDFVTMPDTIYTIKFQDLSMFEETEVELYKTSFTDFDSLLALPLADIVTSLTDTVFSATVTEDSVCIPTSNIDTLAIYIVKLSSSAMSGLDYITDTSIGLRPFIKLP
jgi:hypothetical protein